MGHSVTGCWKNTGWETEAWAQALRLNGLVEKLWRFSFHRWLDGSDARVSKHDGKKADLGPCESCWPWPAWGVICTRGTSTLHSPLYSSWRASCFTYVRPLINVCWGSKQVSGWKDDEAHTEVAVTGLWKKNSCPCLVTEPQCRWHVTDPGKAFNGVLKS